MIEGEITPDDPRAADVRALLDRQLAFANEHSPPEDVHALDLDGLLDPDVSFYCFRRDGRLLGVGALKTLDAHHAELKSMHTTEAARGRGIGRAMVDHLLAVARARGVRRVSIETGTMAAFAPARALYAGAGFEPCAPFGSYVHSPNSTCMTLSLEDAVTATPTIAEFTDLRLVAIYDTVNPYAPGTQPDFCLQLAAEIAATSIVDLGCGTGQITCELARHGYRLIGVDPAPAMLDVARRRPYAERVRWIDGDAGRLGAPDADLAVMTGHVAQFLLTDEVWHATLTALRAALRPGGRLAFESRNPEAREWEAWTREARRSADDPVAGRVDTWSEVDDVRDAIVSYANHYFFAATGEELVSRVRLRFRSAEELTRSLAEARFAVEHVYGDWDRSPAGATTPELIVVAVAVPST